MVSEKQVNDADEEQAMGSIFEAILIALSCLLLVITFPISVFCSIRICYEYERIVAFRFGKLLGGKPKGPGVICLLPCIDNIRKVDTRTTVYDVKRQEILTSDSVTVTVDGVIYYHIFDSLLSVTKVTNVHSALRLMAQSVLRNTLGTRTLNEILSERDRLTALMQQELDKATNQWGATIERIEITDVILKSQLQKAMAAQAEAVQEARAKLVTAQGERDASSALKEASDIIGSSPVALQLRYLQTLASITSEKNSTIIFPIPIDFMKAFTEKLTSQPAVVHQQQQL